MKYNKLFLVVFILTSSSVLMAEDKVYGGVAYHIGNYDVTGYSSMSPKSLELKYGKYLNEKKSFEARYLLKMSSDSISVITNNILTTVKLEVETALSLFLKHNFTKTEKINVYGLIGFSMLRFRAYYSGYVSGSLSKNHDFQLSYGLGTTYSLNKDLSLSVEYIKYLNKYDLTYSGINIGVIKQF